MLFWSVSKGRGRKLNSILNFKSFIILFCITSRSFIFDSIWNQFLKNVKTDIMYIIMWQ